MKKLLLAIIFAAATLAVVDAEAFWGRRYGYYGYGRGNCGSCVKSCEAPCATACAPVCETPCKPACAQTYQVVDDYQCEVPTCVKYVEVEEPAICHRTCRWECPPGTNFKGAAVQGEVNVVNQFGERSTMKHGKSGY